MKKSLRSLAALLSLLLLLTSLSAALISCDMGGGEPTGSETESESETNNEASTSPSAKKTYTVSVQTIGGRPLEGVNFRIYLGDDFIDYGEIGADGIGTVELEPSNDYTVTLSKVPDGYDVAESYRFNGNSLSLSLTSRLIEDEDLTGVKYELGSVMHDFTVTTVDGVELKLSELLKTKKAVMLNFWYVGCGPCASEFPYLNAAYEQYKDHIEVIALNNFPTETASDVKTYRDTMGLTIPMVKDYSALGSAFSVGAYPTSIFIDRYGTVCLIEVGALTSEKPFVAAFSHFSATDYQQKIIENLEELTPVELPNVTMPSSEELGAVLNGAGFSAEYSPETEASDAEYSWPFVIGKKDNLPCVYASNIKKDASFSTLHATVTMKAGDALAVDWFGETELGADILYMLVDGTPIYQLSGVSESWETRYPYVALEDGTHKISFLYVKDDSTDVGTDTVYLRNLRIVSKDDVTVDTYIPRDAATNPNASNVYQSYVTPVFNPADGFYHVGSADGPLLLANLMTPSKLSDTSLNDLGYNGELKNGTRDLYEILVNYCNYSINGSLYGYCPVTEELKGILETAATLVGFDSSNPNQWLLSCIYYDAYGQNVKHLASPVKGIAPFDPFIALESVGDTDTFNTVTYDGRVIMPRGYLYKFVPNQSGAYIVKSQSEHEVNGWIFDENQNLLLEAEITDRPYGNRTVDTDNVSMIVYLEAGKTYFIDIAYYDIYASGTFTFTLRYLGERYDHFHLASPGYFTFTENASGQMNETLAGGIDVALGDDGYYHEKRADGTLGSIVYADFTIATGLFSHSISEMIEIAGFDFSRNEYDDIVLKRLSLLGGDKDACRNFFRTEWGDQYDYFAEEYKLEEILSGTTHGPGKDCTEEIRAYLAKMLPATPDAPELEGCVPVDAALAEILQKLVDKYSFSGVEHSWTKLCYYYKNVGP